MMSWVQMERLTAAAFEDAALTGTGARSKGDVVRSYDTIALSSIAKSLAVLAAIEMKRALGECGR
jgi:hypothetical protein